MARSQQHRVWSGASLALVAATMLAPGTVPGDRAWGQPLPALSTPIALPPTSIPATTRLAEVQSPPKRSGRPSPVALEAKTALVEFENAPFPFDSGTDPRRRKVVSLDSERYSDPRVLLHIPQGFDIRKAGVIVIFFHGHRATIKRDVLDRQRVADQISLSRANAVLVAPQFAVNASDSSAGNFWTPGLFTLFLNEASEQLAILHGFLGLARDFDRLNVLIVGYSGGFAPAAWAIHHGGSNERMRGVVLLDALYGELDKFEKWILADRYRRFFISGYLGSTRARNLQFQQMLDNRSVKYRMSLEERIRPGSITFLPGRNGENHHSYVTRAWTGNPLADILNRLPEYRR
ncbi:MAG: alpha/beta hydrolase [Variibacter sp.]|nr:alpha/beta hydrolase [Variibacter sp.]